ncbi:ABCA6 isoform 7, partial [Pongo abelii]
MNMKQKSVYQQTKALLCKNFLKKWRMKRESLLEWGLSILLGLCIALFSSSMRNVQFPGMAPQNLGRVDKFNSSSLMVVYTPISNLTQQIMNKTALAPLLKGTSVIGAPNKTHMDEILLENLPYAMGIIFNETFSYKLIFFQGYNSPLWKEDFSGDFPYQISLWHFSCFQIKNRGGWATEMLSMTHEKTGKAHFIAELISRGFVALQTAINTAIIEITTNHPVMEELMSVTAITMKTLPFITKNLLHNEMFILFFLLHFSPLVYFISLNVTKERKKSKNLMKMMGLQDSAFWLSWGLIYAGFIFIISIFITIIVTFTQIIVMTGFMVIFILFFLYGLSLVALVFLMSVLLKKAVLTNLVVFLLTLFWGCLGFTVFYEQLPSSLEWILNICSPFAFTAGMIQIIKLDYNLNGVIFPDPSGDSYTMIATFSMLLLDGLIYLLLALYFDKILPYGNERRYSPLFFLNSSSCFQHQRTNTKVIEKEIDAEHLSDDYFEPVAPEFQGKEAIRIRNVKKEYKGKSGRVEALK